MELTPEWITGFVEGEGSFYIGIVPCGNWFTVSPMFSLTLHEDDRAILEGFKSYFGFGSITNFSKDAQWYKDAGINASNTCKYSVGGLRHGKPLRDFFAKQHMFSKKEHHFLILNQQNTVDNYLPPCHFRLHS